MKDYSRIYISQLIILICANDSITHAICRIHNNNKDDKTSERYDRDVIDISRQYICFCRLIYLILWFLYFRSFNAPSNQSQLR